MSGTTIYNPANEEHFATLEPMPGTMTVSVGEAVLCKSDNAIQLSETSPRGKYPTVLYFPKSDVSDALQLVAGRTSHCPLKGDASYFSFNGQEVAWIYDRPLPSAPMLADYVGFYSDKVNIKKS